MPTRRDVGLLALLLTACGAPASTDAEKTRAEESAATAEPASAETTGSDGLTPTVQKIEGLRVFPLPAPPDSRAPDLFGDELGLVLAWVEAGGTDGYQLRVAIHDGYEWNSQLPAVAEGHGLAGSSLAVARGKSGGPWVAWTADEGGRADEERTLVRVARLGARDQWSSPQALPRDAAGPRYWHPSATAQGDRAAWFAWADAREGRGKSAFAMHLRGVTMDAKGKRGKEQLLVEDVGEGCPVASATTASGAITVARDRAGRIMLVGPALTDPIPVNDQSADCPGGAPAVDARGRAIAVLWQDVDGAMRLRRGEDPQHLAPALLIPGSPAGRPEVLIGETTTLVSWLEAPPDRPNLLELRVQAVDAEGRLSPPRRVATLPRQGAGELDMARLGDRVIWVWTDPGDGALPRVRGVQAPLASLESLT